MTFGEYLQQCRIAAGMSFRALGERIGVSGPYLCNLEQHNRACLSPRRFEALCDATSAAYQKLVELWWEAQVAQTELTESERRRLEMALLAVLKERL